MRVHRVVCLILVTMIAPACSSEAPTLPRSPTEPMTAESTPRSATEAAPKDSPGIAVTLPKSDEPLGPTLMVSILATGDVLVDSQTASGDRIGEIFAARAKGEPSTLVIIAADRSVPHGRVIDLIDLAKQGGLTKFSFAVGASDPD